MENNLLTITHAIQLAVAPVFLLTGIAGMMNILSGRLARVVDRRRFLLQREDDRADRAAATRDRLAGLAGLADGQAGASLPRDDVGSSLTGPQGDPTVLSEQAARLARQRVEDDEEIASLDDRARLMYLSIFFAVFAALMVCLVVSTGFLAALTQLDLGRVIAAQFIVSMVTMVVSLVCFLREVYVAVVAGKMHRRA